MFRKLKTILITAFIKQNQYHKHSVIRHSLEVTKYLVKWKQYDLIVAGLLHDIGKPFVAYQDEDDIIDNTYSFTGHEEASYQIVKNWFINKTTKQIIRYHYLITGMAVDDRKYLKTNDKKYLKSYNERLFIWNSLDEDIQEKLFIFKLADDKGKGYKDIKKAVPNFLNQDLEDIRIKYGL